VSKNGYIDSIGKDLKTWSAIDTGVFKMTKEVFPVIELLTNSLGMEVGISDVVRYLGTIGRPFSTCDVGGAFWSDVDTLDDYVAIESILG
jgi:choline kinase